MTPKREYPDLPLIGVGGVVIHEARVLLIRRGAPPLEGQWSIPGGLLEVGETLARGVARELAEETSLDVNVLELIDVFERIQPSTKNVESTPTQNSRPQYHFVIVDYLCEVRGGTACAGTDALECAWAKEEELEKFALNSMTQRALKKAFAMARARKL